MHGESFAQHEKFIILNNVLLRNACADFYIQLPLWARTSQEEGQRGLWAFVRPWILKLYIFLFIFSYKKCFAVCFTTMIAPLEKCLRPTPEKMHYCHRSLKKILLTPMVVRPLGYLFGLCFPYFIVYNSFAGVSPVFKVQ